MSQDHKKITLVGSDAHQKEKSNDIKEITISPDELPFVTTGKDFLKLLGKKNINIRKIQQTIEYERDLKLLQIELIKLQRDIIENNRRVAIIFEGRDAAGKGGTIRRYSQHLNPRFLEVVALNKPNETQKGQWYFQRYVEKLPNPGTISFFDRSWYNRAVVEPVMGFCTDDQYEIFMRQVPEFEHMLYEDGVELIKFWFSISKGEQAKRFASRIKNPLKQWKMSPVDQKAQSLWDKYTHYKEQMFARTHNSFSPWVIIRANDKKSARLESMKYILSKFSYEGKSDAKIKLEPDPNVVSRYHRKIVHIDD
ncbi:MAG: polyphosphate kinase 2 [Bdellovibrionales bacterium]|nr:polyphosphate kinase 2 [Bdellovibrionales bacterium]